jgi:uncharacterized protein YjiS (DUF1127 family)
MPTVDLYLPPQPYSSWHAKRRVHPVAAAWRLVSSWIERAHQRRALAGLNDHQLRDLGITRVDAMREVEKPFWK